MLSHAGAALHRFVPDCFFSVEATPLFLLAVTQVEALSARVAAGGSTNDVELHIVWSNYMVKCCPDAAGAVRLAGMVDSGVSGGPQLSQSVRWGVARLASAFDLPGAEQRIAAELARDPSDRGLRGAATARSAG